MTTTVHAVLEHPVGGVTPESGGCHSLARVIEAHPALAPLLDFAAPDPVQVARAVGLLGPDDADEDLEGIDLGAPEWFEPPAGLAAVRQAIRAVGDAPESLAAAVYDPALQAADVLADLEALERTLLGAQQHETRFRFVTGEGGRAGGAV